MLHSHYAIVYDKSYGREGEMAQKVIEGYNQMHMLARVIVSFDDFLSHPSRIESPLVKGLAKE